MLVSIDADRQRLHAPAQQPVFLWLPGV